MEVVANEPQRFHVIELRFNKIDDIAVQLNGFYESYAAKIKQVCGITQFTTAMPVQSSITAPGRQPQMMYVFHFIITYEGERIVNPSTN